MDVLYFSWYNVRAVYLMWYGPEGNAHINFTIKTVLFVYHIHVIYADTEH